MGASRLREDILGIVYSAIDEINDQSGNGPVLEKDLDTRLLGGDHGVDSLTFVNLIVAVEEGIRSVLGKSVVLVDEDALALDAHPFRTVGTLVHFVEKVVGRAS
jgi:acyl carrier protein